MNVQLTKTDPEQSGEPKPPIWSIVTSKSNSAASVTASVIGTEQPQRQHDAELYNDTNPAFMVNR